MLRDPRRYQKRTKRPAGEGWRGARSEGVGRRREGERANEGEAAGKMGRRRRVRKEQPPSAEEWERLWERQGKKERPRETEKGRLTHLSIYLEEERKRRGRARLFKRQATRERVLPSVVKRRGVCAFMDGQRQRRIGWIRWDRAAKDGRGARLAVWSRRARAPP